MSVRPANLSQSFRLARAPVLQPRISADLLFGAVPRWRRTEEKGEPSTQWPRSLGERTIPFSWLRYSGSRDLSGQIRCLVAVARRREPRRRRRWQKPVGEESERAAARPCSGDNGGAIYTWTILRRELPGAFLPFYSRPTTLLFPLLLLLLQPSQSSGLIIARVHPTR
jgi:hypothetical protein